MKCYSADLQRQASAEGRHCRRKWEGSCWKYRPVRKISS